MDESVWHPIPGFETHYAINKLGQVRSLDRWVPHSNGSGKLYLRKGKILTHSINKDNEPRVKLSVNGKGTSCIVGKLMAVTFIPNPNKYKYIHYKDGNPCNYDLSNIIWSLKDRVKGRDELGRFRKSNFAP